MGVEYGLFHRASKTYIWLGKRAGLEYDRFQMDNAVIAKFICMHVGDASVPDTRGFDLFADTHDTPRDDDDDWIEVANWSKDKT